MSHTEVQELTQSPLQDKSTMTDFEQKNESGPPRGLLKDASSMTETIVLVHSSAQASKRCYNVACQCDQKTELLSSKSSYYSLGDFSDLRRRRSYSDSEYTLVPDKSYETLGKDISASDSDTKVTFTPAASVGVIAPKFTSGGDVKADEDIPRSRTRVIFVKPGDSTNKKTKPTAASASELKSGMEASSSSEDNMMKHRRAVGGSAHKCVWQQQLKTSQQRHRSLRKQVRKGFW